MLLTVIGCFAILLVCTVPAVLPCSPPTYLVNGCSIPANLPYFYKDVFRPACNKHDVCYACGKSRGVSKTACDWRFWKDIINICLRDSRVKADAFCLSVTFDYWTAVSIGGWFHYENPSLGWCSDYWVSGCF